eukprot:14718244-Alexandrium_andersonii.AAC.1
MQAIPIHSPDASCRASSTTVHGRHQRERKRTHAIGKTSYGAARVVTTFDKTGHGASARLAPA